MPSEDLLFLLKKLKIKEKLESQDDRMIINNLSKRTDPNHILMITYKSMLTHQNLLSVWNALLNDGIELQQNTTKPLLIDLINYGYNVDVFVNAIEAMIKKFGKDIVNVKDEKGTTPLMAAAEHGNEKITQLLLHYGADRAAKNNKGQTAADIALGKENASELVQVKEDYKNVYKMVKS